MNGEWQCPKCGAVLAGADAEMTAWGVCPRCGGAIDAAGEPLAKEPEVPERPKGPPAPVTRRVPRLARLMALSLALLAGGYVVWWVMWSTAGFAEHTAPNGEFSLEFPAKPEWIDPGDTLVSRMYGRPVSGSASRGFTLFDSETYTVQTDSDQSIYGKHNWHDLEGILLALHRDVPWEHPKIRRTPPSLVKFPGGAAVEYEHWNATGDVRFVCRLIVVPGRQFYLTVGGPNVRLDDRRVRHFFNSFRYHPKQ